MEDFPCCPLLVNVKIRSTHPGQKCHTLSPSLPRLLRPVLLSYRNETHHRRGHRGWSEIPPRAPTEIGGPTLHLTRNGRLQSRYNGSQEGFFVIPHEVSPVVIQRAITWPSVLTIPLPFNLPSPTFGRPWRCHIHCTRYQKKKKKGESALPRSQSKVAPHHDDAFPRPSRCLPMPTTCLRYAESLLRETKNSIEITRKWIIKPPVDFSPSTPDLPMPSRFALSCPLVPKLANPTPTCHLQRDGLS